MFFAEPPRTNYDLHFQIAGIPVRVHPFFWLATLILGARGFDIPGVNTGVLLLSWAGVVFVSILVHELGHAFTMRYFGQSPHVVLYMLGGLAIADSWGFAQSKARTSGSQILISAAGPGAGFILAGFVITMIYALGGTFHIDVRELPGWYVQWDKPPEIYLQVLIYNLLWVNIFWGLLNLLPVYPLDGGQIARELFVSGDPWNGVIRSLWLSVITGAALAVAGWIVFHSLLMMLLFGSLAYSSYMALQQMRGGGGFGGRPW